MKFDKVLLRRYYNTGVKTGRLIPHEINNFIFEHHMKGKSESLLQKALKSPDSIKVHGNRMPMIVGIMVDDEIMCCDDIQDYMESYGIVRLESKQSKRIAVKLKDGQLVFENIADMLKDKRNFDYIDEFLKETKVKYVKSKDSFACVGEDGKRVFRNLILKADVRCQIIKDEYLDVFPPTPDQEEMW